MNELKREMLQRRLEDAIEAFTWIVEEVRWRPKSWLLEKGIVEARDTFDELLSVLLEMYGWRKIALKAIKEKIYGYEGDLGRFVKWFKGLFNVEELASEQGISVRDALSFLAEIGVWAWILYPHAALMGRSPIEDSETDVGGGEHSEEHTPAFEELINPIVRRGLLPKNIISLMRRMVYREAGDEGAKQRFKDWLLSLFPEEINEEQKKYVEYIIESAWMLYPHKALGGKTPIQLKIEDGCMLSADGECGGKRSLYICEGCWEVFCLMHGEAHVLEKNKVDWRPHILWRIDAYKKYVEKILQELENE